MSRYIFLFWLPVFLSCIFQVFGQISYNPPRGWFASGSSPDEYLMGIDFTIFYGTAPSGFIKSLPNVTDVGFGTVMQQFDPNDYLGTRLRLSCFIKYNNVLNWAGMWMRVDSIHGALDNMFERAIKGTGDWKEFENILDVPEDTSNIGFGILLSGQGEVWIDECKFETVDINIFNLTGPETQNRPIFDLPEGHPRPVSLSFDP